MTNKQPDPLRVADALERRSPVFDKMPSVDVAVRVLRTQHAELQQWKNVFGHLGTADECGNEWIKLQDDIERKDALLKQALRVINHCIPRNEDNADELAEAIKQELSQ